ncbi:antitoxin VbhA family protein [Commensalibacter nepenthis]|uniref:Antitoxin VbhA family protein n=1 Tax=Commensalibacter nepenthis TaxID=3043872 RepID=A0ABT6Q4A9_9PROT|nr:antitoxin VbhA family protein [Commensalibacter sp. TBRC 10068]MDI2111729.1 antitoxin VbhA family protein [Commensalibacter sp. TBRC 10068]
MMNKISEKEKQRRLKAHEMSVGNLRLEGLEHSKEHLDDAKLYINGEITDEERFARIQARVDKIISNK